MSATPQAAWNRFGDHRHPGNTAVKMAITLARRTIPHFRALPDSLSLLLFLRSQKMGGILFLALLLQPAVAIAGSIAWLVAAIGLELMAIGRETTLYRTCFYNTLLAGFSAGYFFRLSAAGCGLVAAVALFTLMVTFCLYRLLSIRFNLPVLNLPFVCGGSVAWLAASRFPSLAQTASLPVDHLNLAMLPEVVQGLLRTCGMILFIPADAIGILILGGLLIVSRITFFLMVASYFLASMMGVVLPQFPVAGDYSAFNHVLAGIAIGGVFLVPSPQSYLLAALGVIFSWLLLAAVSAVWTLLNLPVFTLPFNITVLLLVYVLGRLGFRRMANRVGSTPEATLAGYLDCARHRENTIPRPFLPFSGQWSVYQGTDGQWTHKGAWRHAYDFVIRDGRGRPYRNSGQHLEDYHCFGKPVLAPADGIVVGAWDGLADNPIGIVDARNNWGNWIILHTLFGYYIEISHLQYQSLRVKAGDRVQAGEIIAACGNSGYSPQPHLHMQVQRQAQLGSPTIPFFWSNCIAQKDYGELDRGNRGRAAEGCGSEGGQHLMIRQPLAEGMTVAPFWPSPRARVAFQFLLGDRYRFRLRHNGRRISQFSWEVGMAGDGNFYLGQPNTQQRLSFNTDSSRFLCTAIMAGGSSPLAFLFLALPRFPFAGETLRWREALPETFLLPGGRQPLSFLRSFDHRRRNLIGCYRYSRAGVVSGVVSDNGCKIYTRIELGLRRPIRRIQIRYARQTWEIEMVDGECGHHQPTIALGEIKA